MPRLISFAMTTQQVKDRKKWVTRRWGWDHAKPGMILDGVEKAMGLKKGEKVNRLARIRVVSATKERLDRMVTEPLYGVREMEAEGYPFGMTDPAEFVEKLASSARKKPSDLITRIEFEYLDGEL